MEEEQKPNSMADSEILLSCLEGNNKMAVFLVLHLIILGIRQLHSVAVHHVCSGPKSSYLSISKHEIYLCFT